MRVAVVIFMNKMIDNGAMFYKEIDKKEINGTVEFVMYPSFLMCTVNWKLELCIVIPISIVAMFYTNNIALSVENDNMACYLNAENFAGTSTFRNLIQLVIVCYAIHDNRKTQIMRFIAQKRAEQQQEYLQNIFDKQPDGVLILSKPLEKPKPNEVKPQQKKMEIQSDNESSGSGVNLNALDQDDVENSMNNSQVADASFVSFVNSTHEIFDEGPDFEIVFHNKALMKILNQISVEELN